MAIIRERSLRRRLEALFDLGAIRELTDGQLLERFARGEGEAAGLAFAALVERHGAMVMRVCRAQLADPHECHDAFQATFLVLIEKARGLWVKDSLGPWLHQVAVRTASAARLAAIRRRRTGAGPGAGGRADCRRRAGLGRRLDGGGRADDPGRKVAAPSKRDEAKPAPAAGSKTYTFLVSIDSGPRPFEIRGSLTVTPGNGDGGVAR